MKEKEIELDEMTISPLRVEGRIWRGAAPTAAVDWIALERLGVRYMLDLDSTGLLERATEAPKHGITHWPHPIGKVGAPTEAELDQAATMLAQHECVYISCSEDGVRSGAVGAAYMLKQFGWHYPVKLGWWRINWRSRLKKFGKVQSGKQAQI